MIRGAILLAGAASLAPLLAPSAIAEAGESDRALFVPPETAQVLTRTLRRSLAGGLEILVRRSYRISFVRVGDGYRVDGELIAVEVDAPQRVRAIAEMERNRPDDGLFPFLLDARGLIVSDARPTDRAAARDGASVASAVIASSAMAQAERAEAIGFVNQVVQQGAASAWPRDLFNPAPGNRTEVRRIALPQGGEGEVSVSVAAQSDPAQRHLTAFDRVVVTRLDGTERSSRESWTMQPLMQAIQPLP